MTQEGPPAGSAGSFEQGIRRLEEIVRRLEGGEMSLEESLRLFEEGTRVSRELSATLDRAERTVEALVRDPSGQLRREPFEPGASE
jgi:exodeoxyribonuclease VII small subunit